MSLPVVPAIAKALNEIATHDAERSRFVPNAIAMLSMSRNQDAGQVNLDHDQIFARSSKSVCRVLIRLLPTSLNEDLGLTILRCGKQAAVH